MNVRKINSLFCLALLYNFFIIVSPLLSQNQAFSSFANSNFLNDDSQLILNLNEESNSLINKLSNEFMKKNQIAQAPQPLPQTINTNVTSTFYYNDPAQSVLIAPTFYQHQRVNQLYFSFGQCNATSCVNGNCITPGACECSPGWAQLNNTNQMCGYPLKSQLTAFCLEFFLVFGIGNMYAGRALHGVLKFIIFLSVIVLDIIFRHCFKSYKWGVKTKLNYLFLFLYFACLFWYVFDLVMFALNKYTDNNSMPLWVWGSNTANI